MAPITRRTAAASVTSADAAITPLATPTPPPREVAAATPVATSAGLGLDVPSGWKTASSWLKGDVAGLSGISNRCKDERLPLLSAQDMRLKAALTSATPSGGTASVQGWSASRRPRFAKAGFTFQACACERRHKGKSRCFDIMARIDKRFTAAKLKEQEAEKKQMAADAEEIQQKLRTCQHPLSQARSRLDTAKARLETQKRAYEVAFARCVNRKRPRAVKAPQASQAAQPPQAAGGGAKTRGGKTYSSTNAGSAPKQAKPRYSPPAQRDHTAARAAQPVHDAINAFAAHDADPTWSRTPLAPPLLPPTSPRIEYVGEPVGKGAKMPAGLWPGFRATPGSWRPPQRYG